MKNIKLKRRDINKNLIQTIFSQDKEFGIKAINYYSDGYKELGLFPMKSEDVTFINIDLKDGTYQNLLGATINVKNNTITTKEAVIIAIS